MGRMRIDVHAHYLPAELLDKVARIGASTTGAARSPGAKVTLEQRIEMMDGAGVDMQVLSVAGNQPYVDNQVKSVAAARYVNDTYKSVVERYSGRFAAFGCVPLPHTESAITEAGRCLDQLGFAGITLGCSVNRRPLDEPAFEPFWAELDRRKTVVFLHPVGIGAPMTDAYGLDWKLGAPVEDSVAALRLVASGLTARFPSVRIIIPHLGGIIPYVWSRLGTESGDFGSASQLRQGLRGLYYDSVNRAPGMLCAACQMLDPAHIMLGTDFPYVTVQNYQGFVTAVEESGLPRERVAGILDHNAATLLNLSPNGQ